MTDETLYKGREQTLIKHEIFGRYVQKFSCIVGAHWDSITYIDCFSGPWKERAPDFSDTSFGIAIKNLREAREAVSKVRPGKKLKLRCFFVEKDADAYARLKQHAGQQKDIEIVTYNGEFEVAIPQILKFVQAGGQNTFPFFFIDPTGWTGFAMESLTPIIKLPTVELMINFMTGFVGRFVKTDGSIPGLFGFDVRPQLKDLDGLALEDAAVGAYCAELRRRGKFAHVVPAIVLRRGEDKTHFHILYATRHAKGLEVFKEAEKAAVGVMRTTRAEVKLERAEGPQGFFFAAEDVAPSTTSHLDLLRKHYSDLGRKRVRELLLSRREVPYDEAWAATVQWTPLSWESDLKQWINEWKKAGQLDVPTLGNKERVPKLGLKHRLRCLGTVLD